MTERTKHEPHPSSAPLLRIKKRANFLAVAATGQKFITRTLVIQYQKHSPEHSARIGVPDAICVGFTVTKKQGNAVMRNRIKRRLREAVRLTFPKHAKANHDYVIIGRKAAAERPFELLKGDLEYALKHIHRQKKKAG